MHILHVVGARPNFMKAAPVLRAIQNTGQKQTLVHTGQHYDVNMSDVFFQELKIPAPDVNLAVGSGSHAQQTAEIMARFEAVVQQRKPDVVVVYGDVNSTVAGALVCAKLLIPVGHVEAGLRSFDRTMPEEINRLVTDQLSDLLFTPSEDGDQNLQREGISSARIHRVGNVMIDTLVRCLPLCYPEFLALQRRARLVITDSGGIQEETTYLGVPCLTVRENTERPITVAVGTNVLVGRDRNRLKTEVKRVLTGHGKVGSVPPL